ncbi:MAG: hypothetical protein R3B09_25375 [Nannocystaceae bacterium]
MIEARALTFRYPGRERPVLERCDLTICAGERLLLEAPPAAASRPSRRS